MHRIALNFELKDVPSRVPLIPPAVDGRVTGRDGRSWLWDAIAQASVTELFAARGLPLAVDVNHSSERRAPKGEPSPAAGWIESISLDEEGALWGDVSWTPAGSAAVAGREYRFLSPVFEYDAMSGRIVRLTSVALVNEPNLRLPALNDMEQSSMRTITITSALAAALGQIGIAADATEEQIVAGLNKARSDLDARAQNSALPSLDKYVPRADYDALKARAENAEQALTSHRQQQHQAAVDAEINAALQAGKITPATADYHRASCADESGLARFRAFVAAAPVIAGSAGIEGKPPATGTALNAEEQAVCRALGITQEQFISARR